MAWILKDLYQQELQFLAQDVLQFKLPNDPKKQELVPQLVNEIYTNILLRHDNSAVFWKIVEFFFKYMRVVPLKPSDDSLFQELNIHNIAIYHSSKNPSHSKKAPKAPFSILRNNIICLCSSEQKNIRKTYQCTVCQIQCHKTCLYWNNKDFLCPECLMLYFDPFFEVEERVFSESQLMVDKQIYQFQIERKYFSSEYYLVVKSI